MAPLQALESRMIPLARHYRAYMAGCKSGRLFLMRGVLLRILLLHGKHHVMEEIGLSMHLERFS